MGWLNSVFDFTSHRLDCPVLVPEHHAYMNKQGHSPKRLMVYAHFNPGGRVSEHVFYTLRQGQDAGIDIIFATTSPVSNQGDRQQLLRCVKDIQQVDNIGYDFFAWREGLRKWHGEFHNYDSLILMNSSVIGPITGFSNFLDGLDAHDKDLMGATSSTEGVYHLQSYFLCFSKNCFTSPLFARYWASLRPLASRDRNIVNYELGLAHYFSECGFSVGAYIEQADGSNPTILHPLLLLENGVPFVKIELLRDNPGRIDLAPLRAALSSRYAIALEFPQRTA